MPIVRQNLRLQSANASALRTSRTVAAALTARTPSSSLPIQSRSFHDTPNNGSPSHVPGGGFGGGGVPTYFSKPSLPANTIIRFVPQQTAWIVERMGKFSRILQPGLAILVPFIDRIAYVKSLKEIALEIPSQSAITADNVTLELDGVLYTRVVDAYKARFVPSPPHLDHPLPSY